MVGPWLFAGRRFVATRALKDLRFGTDADLFGGADLGSYLAVYWILDGRHDDHVDWALRQVQWLHANGRMFGERDHIHTLLYRHAFTAPRAGDDAVPAELALDHPFGGLTATLVRPAAGRDRDGSSATTSRERFAPELELGFTPIPLPAGRAGDASRATTASTGACSTCRSRRRAPTPGGTSSGPPPTRLARRRHRRDALDGAVHPDRSPAPTPTPTSCGERASRGCCRRAGSGRWRCRTGSRMCPMGANLGEPDGTVGDAQAAWYEARARGGAGLRHRRVGGGRLSRRRRFDRAPDRGVGRRPPPGPAAPGRRRAPPRRRHRRPARARRHATACSTSRRADRCSCRRRSGRRRPTRCPGWSPPEEAAAMMAPFASPTAAYSRAGGHRRRPGLGRRPVRRRRPPGRQRRASTASSCTPGTATCSHAFLSPHSNQRDDRWGGSVEARAELLVEVVRAVRAAVGPDVPALGARRHVRGPPRPGPADRRRARRHGPGRRRRARRHPRHRLRRADGGHRHHRRAHARTSPARCSPHAARVRRELGVPGDRDGPAHARGRRAGAGRRRRRRHRHGPRRSSPIPTCPTSSPPASATASGPAPTSTGASARSS